MHPADGKADGLILLISILKIVSSPRNMPKGIPSQGNCRRGHFDLCFVCLCSECSMTSWFVVVVFFSSGSELYTGEKFAFFNTKMFVENIWEVKLCIWLHHSFGVNRSINWLSLSYKQWIKLISCETSFIPNEELNGTLAPCCWSSPWLIAAIFKGENLCANLNCIPMFQCLTH